jgi:hypothetical protein
VRTFLTWERGEKLAHVVREGKGESGVVTRRRWRYTKRDCEDKWMVNMEQGESEDLMRGQRRDKERLRG